MYTRACVCSRMCCVRCVFHCGMPYLKATNCTVSLCLFPTNSLSKNSENFRIFPPWIFRFPHFSLLLFCAAFPHFQMYCSIFYPFKFIPFKWDINCSRYNGDGNGNNSINRILNYIYSALVIWAFFNYWTEKFRRLSIRIGLLSWEFIYIHVRLVMERVQCCQITLFDQFSLSLAENWYCAHTHCTLWSIVSCRIEIFNQNSYSVTSKTQTELSATDEKNSFATNMAIARVRLRAKKKPHNLFNANRIYTAKNRNVWCICVCCCYCWLPAFVLQCECVRVCLHA